MFMTVKQGAEYLAMKEKDLRFRLEKGLIPRYKVSSRAIRLKKEDLDAFMESGKVIGKEKSLASDKENKASLSVM